MFGFLITHFAVGMSVETFKSKKSCSKSQCAKVTIQKINSFLCYGSIFIMTKMSSRVAIQKLIQPYPAGSYPISCCHGTMCNSIFLIANIKHLQFPDYSFCCGCICRNNQVQEKIVQSLSVFLMAKIEYKNGVFI